MRDKRVNNVHRFVKLAARQQQQQQTIGGLSELGGTSELYVHVHPANTDDVVLQLKVH